jgi:peptidylprolyl isomerase
VPRATTLLVVLAASAAIGQELPAQDGAAPIPAAEEIAALEYARVPSVELFLPHLADTSAAVRRRALLALGRVTPGDAAPAVMPLLADGDADVRRMAAFTLGQLADTTATTALAGAVRRSATGEHLDVQLADAALEALGKVGGAPAAAAAATHLADHEPVLRATAALALARMADTTRVDDVVARLGEEDDASVLWTLARACEAARATPRVIESLLDLLEHRSPVVRGATARALGRLGDARALRPLLPFLIDGEWRVRVETCEALGRIGDAAALESLMASAVDPIHHVREAAVTALGKIGDSRATDALLTALGDTSTGVRRAAATALGRVASAGDDTPGDDAGGDATARTARVDAALQDAVDQAPAAVAAAALGALAARRGVAVLDLLIEHTLIGYPSPVRIAATAALGELGEPAALGTLVALLEDPDPVIATVAASALGELGDDAAQWSLLSAYDAHTGFEDFDVRLAAVEALGRIGDRRARPTLHDAVLDRDPRLRELALASLDSVRTRAPADSVTVWARQDSVVRAMPPASGGPRLGDAPGDFPLVAAITTVRRLRLVTSRGAIELELLPEWAPMTVESFVRLAEAGFYADGVFHRVVPDFVVQGGCPRHDGWGGPGYALRSEWNPLRFGIGTVGMAHAGRDTGGSQFFITHSPQPHLDGRYTVFARVVSGMSVVDAIDQGDAFTVQRIER